MEIKEMQCPNCNAEIEIDDGFDTFFCKYCGRKIILADMSAANINAKVKLKQMEHQEKIKDKVIKPQKYKLDKEEAKEKRERKDSKFSSITPIAFLI